MDAVIHLGPAFETCSSFFLGWSTVSLLDSCGQQPKLEQPPISEGPQAVWIPPMAIQPSWKAPFISVGTVSWMPLPDHLSPLAWGSGDTCGFNIMHRCDLGEENYSCGLTSAGVTGLWNRGGQEGGRQKRPADNLRLCRLPHSAVRSAMVSVLHCKESMSYWSHAWTRSPLIILCIWP